MVLEVKNLNFSYANKSILNELNFSLESGEVMGILGRNGVGKSTLLKLILGLLNLEHGKILLNSQSIDKITNKERAKLIGYVPQSQNLAFSFSVKDMILMGINANIGTFYRPSKKDTQTVEYVAQIVGISDMLNLNVDELSGGMMQLAFIARALVLSPKILIMDEPTSYLDMAHQDDILNLIKRLKNEFNTSVVFTSHCPDHALCISDKTLLLSETNYQFGKTKEILTSENLNALFGLEFINFKTQDKARLAPKWSV